MTAGSDPGANRRRGLFLIQDGLGDRPHPELGGLTPLEAALTPTLDRLAWQGRTGLVDIVGPGVQVGTDIGHLVLFGQDPDEVSCGRGAIEAAGMGIFLAPDEVALRFNFATLDPENVVVDRRAGRIRSGTLELARSLNDERFDSRISVRFVAATEHRGILILKGAGLSAAVSDSDPSVTQEKLRVVRPQDSTGEAARTAHLLNQVLLRCRSVLDTHPLNRQRQERELPVANAILTRGAGTACRLAPIQQRLGLRIACVSGECTVLGMARLAGFKTISLPGMTANLDTDLSLKTRAVVGALREYDVVYVHVKGPDIAGHDGLPDSKRDFISRADAMLAEIVEATEYELLVAAAADHATPCELGDHSDDPVPVLLQGPGVAADPVSSYSERACAAGDLGRLRGKDFLELFFDAIKAAGS